MISTDFYSAYQSIAATGTRSPRCGAGRTSGAGSCAPATPTRAPGLLSKLWLDRIAALYTAHRAWASALRDSDHDGAATAGQAFQTALGVIDTVRREQQAHPDLLHPAAAKVWATLDREWDGLAAHRELPRRRSRHQHHERSLRTPVVGRKNFHGSGAPWAADLAAPVWTITATLALAGLNPITYLTAYLDAGGTSGGKPTTGTDLEPSCRGPPPTQTWPPGPDHPTTSATTPDPTSAETHHHAKITPRRSRRRFTTPLRNSRTRTFGSPPRGDAA